MRDPVLLTRDDFRNGVFARDNHKCIFCEKPGKDAHHIMERRLWPDGGYYLDNGVSVCEEHHLKCESTEISVEDVRIAAKIARVILPPHMYDDQVYDKWGNVVLPNGQRLRGELFYDESVQKIIAPFLGLFTHWVKYPRTYHLPWSQNLTDDDRMLPSIDQFIGQEVVVTTKMDGENTTMYSDHIHARSVDSKNHVSRNWVKGFWAQIMGDIPEGWRICGENLFATHSIHYKELPSYFMGFSVWNDRNICLSWDETLEYFKLLGITPVPELYRGVWDEAKIKSLWDAKKADNMEGYVVRFTDAYTYGDFSRKVGKFVRKGHVMTTKHWMMGQMTEPNELRKE
jgi:hypothetical protein